jgi:glycosyltransferase involved in cell wall biosynthesis
MKTVLFFDPNLNERGTSIATYDYAHFNEVILGNKSIIVSLNNAELKSFEKFNDRFETHIVNSHLDINNISCDYFYSLKYGFNDNVSHLNSKNLVHVVFPSFDPHGDVYAYVSEWLANTHGYNSPFVPHMVNLPSTDEDFKEFFNTKDKLVIGWYGGNNFEIPFARQAVIDVAKKRKDIIFLFMNQEPFSDLENTIFISGTTDQEQKVAFINTCDVMIHARERGETFGLAIAEFSTKNKPIITYQNSLERNHIEILKDKGIYYQDYNSLCNILLNLNKSDMLHKEWNCYQEYTPEKVMLQFNNVFLNENIIYN